MGAFTSLKWRRTASRQSINLAMRSEGARDFLIEKNADLKSLLSLTGVVTFDAGMTAKQKAIQLLKAAAEVEHQFIVQYLYALYCCGTATAHTQALMLIAQEEMGHLITVQNLLATLKAEKPEDRPPYLERLRTITGDQQPSPFKLEPLSLSFIARFLVSESNCTPALLPTSIAQHLPDGLALQDIHRVGVLYAHLYVLFQKVNAPGGPWTVPLGSDLSALQDLGHLEEDDFGEPDAVKAALNQRTDWHGTKDLTNKNRRIMVLPEPLFSDKATMRDAALTVIHLIAGQGEGIAEQPGDTEPSHAQRLRTIYDALESAGQTTQQALGTDRFPTDPYTTPKTTSPGTEGNLIDAPAAVAAANAFDTVYEALLLQIARSVASQDSAARSEAADAAFDKMREIDPASRDLVAMGRKQNGTNPPDKLAAPPFTFPAAGIPGTLTEIEARLSLV